MRIAIGAIALSLSVMIISVAIVTGFKTEVRNKVIGFGAHIRISNYDSNFSFEAAPIDKNLGFYKNIPTIKGISHIQIYATKAGIFKTDDEIQGIVLKGVAADFKWEFFEQNLVHGNIFRVDSNLVSNKIVISKHIASLLKLQVGNNLLCYFIDRPPLVRKFEICGIYETSLEDFDKLFAFIDIAHIQKLNKWEKNQISGFEIFIDNFEQLEYTTEIVNSEVGYNFFEDGSRLAVTNIKEEQPQIFDWLSLTDMNVVVILTIIILVAAINMISALLILILERTTMVGVLKALGMKNRMLQKIFIYNAAFILGKGLLYGNIIGIAICIIQKYFKIIPLDPASYYITSVPINIDIAALLLLNIGTFLIITFSLLLPSFIINKIDPVKTIRFN